MTASSVNRLLLGIVLVAGCSFVWQTLVGGALSVWQSFNLVDPLYAYYSVVVTSDGDAFVNRASYDMSHGRLTQKNEKFTLSGEPLTLDKKLADKNAVAATSGWTVPMVEESQPFGRVASIWMREPLPWNFRPVSIQEGPSANFGRTWHFIRPDRHGGTGYFVGYDNVSKQRVGYLGTSGFSVDLPDASEQFHAWSHDGASRLSIIPDPYEFQTWAYGQRPEEALIARPLSGSNRKSDVGVLAVTPERDAVFAINMTEKSVRRFSTSGLLAFESQGQTDFAAGLVGEEAFDIPIDEEGTNAPVATVLLRFDDRVEVRSLNFDLLKSIKLPELLRAKLQQRFTIQAVRNGYVAVVNEPSTRKGDAWTSNMNVVWFDEQGHVTRQEAASFPGPRMHSTTDLTVALTMHPCGVLSTYWSMVASPMGLFDVDTQTVIRRMDEPITVKAHSWALRRMWHGYRLQIVLCFVSGVITGAICLARQRRYRMSRFDTICWSLLVFCFGPIGLIAYFSHRTWNSRDLTVSAAKAC